MIITRILNNNVVEAKKNGRELVVMGSGLAFGLKVGKKLDEKLIEKVFELSNDLASMHIYKLIEEVPFEYWDFVIDVEKLIKRKLKINLTSGLYIALLDHIYVAVKRSREGQSIPYRISYNIKGIYEKEIEVANTIVKMIEENFRIKLDESETYLIVIHIMDAQNNIDMSMIELVVENVNGILQIVKKKFPNTIDENSVSYERFKTHIRYFVERVVSKKIENNKIEGIQAIYSDFHRRHLNQYNCEKEIKNYISKKLNYGISIEEEFYILLYLVKVTVK